MRRWTIAALLVLLLALCACGAQPDGPEEAAETPAVSQPEERPLDTSVIQGREGELDFAFSLEDWIAAYNVQYRAAVGEDFLKSPEAWHSQTFPTGVHSQQETVQYEFLADERMFSLPTMTVYVPQGGSCVQEITVNFDDHAYSDEGFALYQELCDCTIRTLCPDLEAERVQEIGRALDDVAYETLRLNKQRYGGEVVPVLLYHRDGIGIFSHFALGDYVRLCVIPVTEETLAAYARQGAEIRDLSSMK